MAVKERRVLLLGDPGTGKTTLLKSTSCEVSYSDSHTVYYKLLERPKKKRQVLLALWDVPSEGAEAETARAAVYPKLDAAIIVFALNDPASLVNARIKWYKQVRKKCKRKIPIVLVGTKEDLRDSNSITYTEALHVADKMRAYAYVECNATTRGLESLQPFMFALRAVLKSSKCTVM